MKIYSKESVLDAALNRIRYIFDEFPEVVVGFSGGKDSTATLNLALQIAEEKNRLPLKVLFVDQEAEWQGTIDYVEKVMKDPRVEPMWFQMPMLMTNNASSYSRFSKCWDEAEKDKWIHPKSEISIKENKYKTERFHNLFEAIFRVEFANTKACYLAGVRAEEAPKRFVALTNAISYKWLTWGKILNKRLEHYTFYPLYDWSFVDIWKYINTNKFEYNKVYDAMYQHGVTINDMRISNLHHETAIQVLLLVQEIEPDTWNRVAERIEGASSIKHIKNNSFQCPKDLPYMFKDWEDYAMHLANNIIQEDKYRDQFFKHVFKLKTIYDGENIKDQFWRVAINTILSSDWDFTKMKNFEMQPQNYLYRNYKKNKLKKDFFKSNKYNKVFTQQELQEIIKCIEKL